MEHGRANIPGNQVSEGRVETSDNHVGRRGNSMTYNTMYEHAKVRYLPSPANNLCSRYPSRC